MRLRAILLVGCVCVAGACSFWSKPSGDNVLVIVVDGLRFDAISRSVGAARTPNIQRLAEDGIAFTACFSHSSATQPAHAAILASRLPHSSAVLIDAADVAPDLGLLTEELARNRYTTMGVISDWRRWFETPDRSSANANESLDRGFAHLRASDDEPASAREVTDGFLSLLSTAPADQPWFAFVQYTDTEAPYDSHGSVEVTADIALDGKALDKLVISEAPLWKREITLPPGTHRFILRCTEPFKLARFRCEYAGEPLPLVYEAGKAEQPSKVFVLAVENPGSAPIQCAVSARMHDLPDRSAARARYKLEVESIDRAIGEIVNQLQQSEIYDDTCIVLTSGHGEALGEHAEVAAFANLYDANLRVPLIVKPPADSTARVELLKVQTALVRHIDLAPTLLEMLGLPPLEGAEGQSLFEPGHRVLVAEVHPPQAKDSTFAMRDDRYKMIFTPAEDRFEMYDSLRDTLELENIFMIQGHVRQAWQKQLRALAKQTQGDERIGYNPPQ